MKPFWVSEWLETITVGAIDTKKIHHANPTGSKIDGWVLKTQEEVDKVQQLRENLQDIKDSCNYKTLNTTDDHILIRYLRARDLNLKQAEKMFRNSYAWRVKHNPESKKFEYLEPELFFSGFATGGLFGIAKNGVPIFYDRLGRIDINIMHHLNVEDFVTFEINKLERAQDILDEATRVTGIRQYQFYVINDLKGLNSSHLSTKGLNILKEILAIDDTYYPELAHQIILTNAPYIFKPIWAIVKLFLDAATKKKIQIYSHAAEQEIQELINESQIPKYIKGGMANEELADKNIRAGGKIPKNWSILDSFKDCL